MGIDKKECVIGFIDVMGTKNRILSSDSEEIPDYDMAALMMDKYEEMASENLVISVFSDCMYVVSDERDIDTLFAFLASLSYFLFENKSNVNEKANGSLNNEKIMYLKVRGGITYGEVDMLQKDNRCERLKVLSGKAMVQAYKLESEKAVYPRIIVDEALLNVFEDKEEAKKQYHLVEDKDFCYFDFLDYMWTEDKNILKKDKENMQENISNVLKSVQEELQQSLDDGKAKLAGQLLWYQRYLETVQKKFSNE